MAVCLSDTSAWATSTSAMWLSSRPAWRQPQWWIREAWNLGTPWPRSWCGPVADLGEEDADVTPVTQPSHRTAWTEPTALAQTLC